MLYLRRFAVIAFILMSLLIAIVPVYGANATVTDCTNFAGIGTISEAVDTANVGGGTITFACSGTIIFTNRLSIIDNVTINANGNTVIFDEVGDNNGFFTVAGVQFTLNGFTLQNGNENFGGAISISVSSVVTINDSTFINNSAATAGGAIRNNGTVTVNNSTFLNNSGNIGGGAIYSLGVTTINNSTFINNSTTNQGGAVSITLSGTGTITDSYFRDNVATVGGGAVSNANTTSSQNNHYENNTCDGNAMTDNGGNTVLVATGCPGGAPITLDVSALTCNNDSAVFTINAGDANFSITGTGAGLPINPASAGLYGLVGPSTWANIIITELRGDRQSVNIGGITCPSGVIIPPTEPIISSAITILGCALDTADGVEVAGAPDNTYCRILMKNGGVVSYSGAIPADLIRLGVVLAVDVYRLEGGATVNTFPAYAQVCLSGTG
ncbi:MAG TPA: hypothetical protein PLZ51_09595, partial [Aggregatilineales bacterium]|nr:hypothetical protein [Aggregatilineales bacterium]